MIDESVAETRKVPTGIVRILYKVVTKQEKGPAGGKLLNAARQHKTKQELKRRAPRSPFNNVSARTHEASPRS